MRDNRHPIPRRGTDQGEVPQSHERQVQCTWDGRGRQRQHVHGRPQLLEAFLVAHTETLLLIDDQEAQISELDIG